LRGHDYLIGFTIYSTWLQSLIGLAIIAAGLPVYWYFARRQVPALLKKRKASIRMMRSGNHTKGPEITPKDKRYSCDFVLIRVLSWTVVNFFSSPAKERIKR
jgi:hypothetical protein